MRFKIPIGQQKLKSVITEHNGEELLWDTTWYVKGSHQVENSPATIFAEINNYISMLAPSRQQKMFDVYRSIYDTIGDSSFNIQGMNLVEVLIKRVKELYETVTEEEILAYITRPGTEIILPSGITNEYGDQSPEQTYLLSDHIGLVGISMALRMMLPIWGEFIRNYSDENETGFKEYTAMRLILNAWPNTSIHRTRLLNYLTFLNKKEPVNITATYSGVGTVEKPEWQLSTVYVRRLPVSELSNDPENPMSKLVSNIFNFVTRNTYNTLERKFTTRIKDKHEVLLRNSGEDKTSFSENYKIKEIISAGELATLCVQFRDPTSLFNRIDDTVPYALYETCMREVKHYEAIKPSPHQIHLMQWVMGLAMPSTGVELLTREAFLRAMVGTQALLWHWGFPDLAVMVTVKPVEDNTEELFTTDTKPKVPKEHIPKLMALYPHHQPITSRGSQDEIYKQQKSANTALAAIQLITQVVGVGVWYTFCPDVLLSQVTYAIRRQGRHFLAPNDLKIQLSQLITKINERSEHVYRNRRRLEQEQKQNAS